ncbi:MAG: anti-sigma factor antagonist [Defluviitaleaceae bacterium]|nr:anti-sigma factor antagonist [Defluviitaleaceae bacterium]
MALTFRAEGDCLVAEISGEIDHHSASGLKDRISAEYKRGTARNLRLDFARVTFMDSSGVGMVIGRYKEAAERGGDLSVCGLSGELARLFEMAGLHKIISVK